MSICARQPETRPTHAGFERFGCSPCECGKEIEGEPVPEDESCEGAGVA